MVPGATRSFLTAPRASTCASKCRTVTQLDPVRVPEFSRGAACTPERLGMAQVEVDAIFFPKRGHSAARAKAICRACAVRDECLAYAVSLNIEHGVWGSLTPWERRPVKRSAKRASPAA